MRRAVVIVAVLLATAGCDRSLPGDLSLEEALDRQPAELVVGELRAERVRPGCPDIESTELTLVEPADDTERWRLDVPETDRAPVLIGDVLVVEGPVVTRLPPSVAAVDLATGAPRWQRFLAAERVSLQGEAAGVAVVLADDRLVGVDPATGEIGWELPGGHPMVGSIGGTLVLDAGPELHLVAIDTGATAVIPSGDAVLVEGDQVVVQTGATVAAYDAAGQPRWSTNTPVSPVTSYYGESAVRLDSAGAALVLSSWMEPGRAAAVDPATGALLWDREVAAELVVAPGTVLLDDGAQYEQVGTVVAVDAATGAERWTQPIVDGLSGYVGDEGGRAVFEMAPFQIRTVDLATGAMDLGPIDQPGSGGPPASVDGVLATADGWLAAEPSGDATRYDEVTGARIGTERAYLPFLMHSDEQQWLLTVEGVVILDSEESSCDV